MVTRVPIHLDLGRIPYRPRPYRVQIDSQARRGISQISWEFPKFLGNQDIHLGQGPLEIGDDSFYETATNWLDHGHASIHDVLDRYGSSVNPSEAQTEATLGFLVFPRNLGIPKFFGNSQIFWENSQFFWESRKRAACSKTRMIVSTNFGYIIRMTFIYRPTVFLL